MVHWLGNTRNTSSGSPSVYNYILSNVYPFELLVHAILQLLAKLTVFGFAMFSESLNSKAIGQVPEKSAKHRQIPEKLGTECLTLISLGCKGN